MNKFTLQGRTVQFYESIDSTNIRAKLEAEKGAGNGVIIVADMQTAGRGRRGRSWESPAGSNLYFTLILKPDFAPDKASMLTLVMALAVVKGVEKVLYGAADCLENDRADRVIPMIKWPNDIVINGKKVCGILTEMSARQNTIDYVLIGVGVNVHKQKFAPELVNKATCLETECGQKVSRRELLQEIMNAFDEYDTVFEKQENLTDLKELYNRKLINCNREVRILDPQGEYSGTATGINDKGELCVVLPDGRKTSVYAGEVSVRGLYGYV